MTPPLSVPVPNDSARAPWPVVFACHSKKRAKEIQEIESDVQNIKHLDADTGMRMLIKRVTASNKLDRLFGRISYWTVPADLSIVDKNIICTRL